MKRTYCISLFVIGMVLCVYFECMAQEVREKVYREDGSILAETISDEEGKYTQNIEYFPNENVASRYVQLIDGDSIIYEYYENGSLHSRVTYKNMKLENIINFDPNGRLIEELTLYNPIGQKVSITVESVTVSKKENGLINEEYVKKGEPKVVDEYIMYKTIFDSTGRILKDGTVKTYHKNGKIESEIQYENKVENGLARYYSEEGALMKEVDYENGKEKVKE